MKHEEKVKFPDISSRSWEHPADKAALAALHQLRGLDEVVKAFIGVTSEKSLRLYFLASSVRVNERQFPKLHALVRESCEILDIRETPEVFVSQNPMLNSFTLGIKKPLVVVNSALVSALDESELLGVLAHELGHVASGHVLYKTLLWLLVQISSVATLGIQFPIREILLQAVIASLREWDRKSELSADRAALLVLQEVDPSYRLLMKMAGGSHLGEMNIEEFFAQAEEYERGGDVLDNLYKALQLVGQTHPFPVLRVKELKSWIDSGSYDRILKGDYAKRRHDYTRVDEDFREAASAYEKDFARTRETFESAFSSLTKEAAKAGKDFETFLKGMFDKR